MRFVLIYHDKRECESRAEPEGIHVASAVVVYGFSVLVTVLRRPSRTAKLQQTRAATKPGAAD